MNGIEVYPSARSDSEMKAFEIAPANHDDGVSRISAAQAAKHDMREVWGDDDEVMPAANEEEIFTNVTIGFLYGHHDRLPDLSEPAGRRELKKAMAAVAHKDMREDVAERYRYLQGLLSPAANEASRPAGRGVGRPMGSRNSSFLGQVIEAMRERSGWQDDAACNDQDPSLFFPDPVEPANLMRIAKAINVCRGCVAIDECKKYGDKVFKNEVGVRVYGGIAYGLSNSEKKRTEEYISALKPAS